MKIKQEEIRKILCVKPRGIGDIILSTIVLENLRTAFPKAEIHYLTEEFAKRAVENNTFVSKILTFKKDDLVFKTINKVRREKYNLVLDLYSNPKTAQITFLSGAKYRAGFEKRGRRYAYNILGKSGSTGKHAAEDNLVLLNILEIPINSKKIIYATTKEEKLFADNFLKDKIKRNEFRLIGIIPSGGWESKRCDASKLIEICNEIQKSIKTKFIILWGPGDEKDAKEIFEGLKPNPLIAPSTSFGELSGLIEKCDLIVANDSGPMHVAAALGIPTIGIFGPTNPENHRPFSSNSDFVIKSDLHCIICNKLVCPYKHECMLELDPKEFATKAKKLLGFV
ncbi:MAG: glycosyltransferase family 9 protein [Ignavibacteriaceae bacterium]|nr:glycosyltransferase family 9 protein [Ignavibacteriaceae bacterium]MCW8960631.1 glycosyltransferase family 9 protein [Ignavibacteriaceae bacterium]MCW8996392.1 glycosyltransferase family 9 protein [Psychromonas sp.]MCW9097043.1 glycosyltransferase family 9 protein [Ignavibacteriaceae bacterium]